MQKIQARPHRDKKIRKRTVFQLSRFSLGLIVLALVLFLYFIRGFSFDFFYPTFLFAAFVTVTDFFSLYLPRGGTISTTPAILVTAILLFPFPNVLAIAVLGLLLSSLIRERRFLSSEALVKIAQVVIVVSVSTFFYSLFGGVYLLSSEAKNLNLFSLDAIPVLVVFVSYFLTDISLGQLTYSLKSSTRFTSNFVGAVRLLGYIYVACFSTGVLVALVYQSLTHLKGMVFWGLLIYLPLLAITQYSFSLYLGMRRSYQATIKALASAIEVQDTTSRGHGERVADLAVDIGRELGIQGENLEKLSYAALLHDIGKLSMEPEEEDELSLILGKEREEEKDHAEVGAELIEQVEYLKDVADIVRKHHVPYEEVPLARKRAKNLEDGYPLEARIINVASTYDRLTQIGPAEELLSPAQALEKLKREQGIIYDPKVVRALGSVLKRRGEVLA